MNIDNKPAFSCDIRFGLSGYSNDSLMAQFYPEDIPDDWLLDYYSNEFRVILLSYEEIDSVLSESDTDPEYNGSEQTQTRMIQLDELVEELSDSDCVIVVDLAQWPAEQQIQLMADQNDEAGLIIIDSREAHIIESNTWAEELQWGWSLKKQPPGLFVHIGLTEKIEPPRLKELVEWLRKLAESEQAEQIDVIFTANEHALENCRNVILLEAMM